MKQKVIVRKKAPAQGRTVVVRKKHLIDRLGLWKGLLAMGGIVLALLLLSAAFLGIFTRHGQEITVPDFTDLSLTDAQTLARKTRVRLEVTDSVFIPRMTRGSVYSQNPRPGSRVKEDRRIMLTIHALAPRMLRVPDLVGLTTRQARAEISSCGFRTGKLEYVNDMATNRVLAQSFRGEELEAGSMLESGSVIDLRLGLNEKDSQTAVPDLTGLKMNQCIDVLQENYLNAGRMVFGTGVRDYADSLRAVVVRQSPTAEGGTRRMGTPVTVWFSLEASAQ